MIAEQRRIREFLDASPRAMRNIKLTVEHLKTLIEGALHKRNLPTDRTFSDLRFTYTDRVKIMDMLVERWQFHLEVYGFDTIEDLVRIVTSNFNQ